MNCISTIKAFFDECRVYLDVLIIKRPRQAKPEYPPWHWIIQYMEVFLFNQSGIWMVISEIKAGPFQLGREEWIQVWIIP